MAVVINEFEVVSAPPPPAPRTPAMPPSAPTPTPSTTHDIANILRHVAERHERVRAH